MEASGGYESIFCAQSGNHGILHAVVNARRVREFARGMGIDAKTDAIDARVISKFASVLKPIPTASQSDEERKHSALVTRRSQLVDLITQEKNRLKQTWDEDAKRSVQKTVKHFSIPRYEPFTRRTPSPLVLVSNSISTVWCSPIASTHIAHNSVRCMPLNS
jgi:transposase